MGEQGLDAETAGFGAALFGIGAIVIIPLLYGGVAFLSGLLVAFLYNDLAGVVGGVEFESA